MRDFQYAFGMGFIALAVAVAADLSITEQIVVTFALIGGGALLLNYVLWRVRSGG